MLPCKIDSAFVASQRKKPVAVIARLRQIMFDMSERQLITSTEHRLIEDNLRGLDDVITTGERIRATPVPPIYVAHATRLMMVYLFFLPIALLGTQLNGFTQVLVTTTVGYAMLGLDEISYIFEEPFRLMPLYQIAKVSMLDVADAFTLQPPALRSNGTDLASIPIEPQPYW
jgi:predicted membrane chloride channel (bestrophin family)